MPRFIGQSEEFAGRSWELTGASITLGRLDDNQVQIEHNSVSGHHAELVLDEYDYKVVDLDSTNGTRVNGERITEQKLRRNDVVRFGNIEVLYDSEYSPPAQALPEPSARIVLSPNQGSGGRPPDFANLSPFPKGLAEKNSLSLVTLLLVVLALAGVGYFAYTILSVVPEI
jgi:pSer/pThr/pTyr-binding forkhead associated (FHA) protein